VTFNGNGSTGGSMANEATYYEPATPRRSAIARLMPLDAPVMTALLPVKSSRVEMQVSFQASNSDQLIRR
jgi:hypothetical protein